MDNLEHYMDFVTQIAISRGYTIAHTTTTLNMGCGLATTGLNNCGGAADDR